MKTMIMASLVCMLFTTGAAMAQDMHGSVAPKGECVWDIETKQVNLLAYPYHADEHLCGFYRHD